MSWFKIHIDDVIIWPKISGNECYLRMMYLWDAYSMLMMSYYYQHLEIKLQKILDLYYENEFSWKFNSEEFMEYDVWLRQ